MAADQVLARAGLRAHRDEVTASRHDEDDPRSLGIGAAGRRQNDSPQRDFYASLQRECTTDKMGLEATQR